MSKVSDRFWSKVAIAGEDECWLWTAGKSNRYGKVTLTLPGLDGKTITSHTRSHRMTWCLTYGPIPAELHVCHSCDEPLCCNPRHLFVGTHADNMADMTGKGRGRRRLRGKLDAAAVAGIRADQRSYREIAPDYGVNWATVGKIKRGESHTSA